MTRQSSSAPLPRGRHAASPEVVAESQRARLIAAMTEVAARNSYARTTVLDVVAAAGVAKPAFYAHFADKQACLIAAYDAAVAELMASAAAALSASARPEERIEHGVPALLEYVAANEAQARLILIEIVAAGEAAVAHMKRTHSLVADQYIAMREVVRESYPEYPSLTHIQGLAVVGAVTEPVGAVLINDGAAAVPALADQLVPVVKALSMIGTS